MKINVALLRVSSDMQDFESQKTGINDYCRANKLIIDKYIQEYDVSGYSTKLEDRHGLMEIKQLAFEDKINTLVIFNIDRLGRDSDMGTFITMLDNLNVKIISVTEGIISNNDLNNKLINNVKLWMAENESYKTSLRVKSGLKAVNESNKYAGGTINYGYKLESGNLVIDKCESAIVKRIFEEYLTKGSIAIARDLNNEGLLKRSNKGMIKWNTSTITKMLENQIYIGYKRYGCAIKTSNDKTDKNRKYDRTKTKYQDYNPTLHIIDNDVFFKVQQLRKERHNAKGESSRTNTRTKELLEGLVWHKCGDQEIRKMYINYRYSNSGRIATYKCKHCSGYAYEGVQKNFTASAVNKFVEKYILKAIKMLDTDKLRANLIRLQNSDNDIDIKIKSLKKELEKQVKINNKANKELEMYFLGESNFSSDVINNMINISKNKISSLEEDITKSQIEINDNLKYKMNIEGIIDRYQNFESVYLEAKLENQKALLHEIIDKVIIDNNDIEIVLKHGTFF